MDSLPEAIRQAHLLVVDDNVPNLNLLRRMLEGAGYANMECVSDPRQVPDLLGRNSYDLVLLDIQMPHLDGYQLMRMIRGEASPALLPILVLTAQSDEKTRSRCLREGANDILTKPLDRLEALTRIRNMVEIRVLQEARRMQMVHLEQMVVERTEALRIEKERAEAASRSKSDFLAVVSHELRTPLNAIIGFTEVVQAESYGDVGDKNKEFLEDIKSSATDLLRLVNDVLDVVRVDTGMLTMTADVISVTELLRPCIGRATVLAERHGVMFNKTIANDLPEVSVDWDLMRRALDHILANAIKFTRSGGEVVLRAERDDKAVRFTVSDTGVGIEPENIPRILQPFGQIDNKLDRTTGGIGVGLTLARAFLDQHGGLLDIDSTPGKGTRVFVTLEAHTP